MTATFTAQIATLFRELVTSEGRREEMTVPVEISFEADSPNEGVIVICDAAVNNGQHIINTFPSVEVNGSPILNPAGSVPNLTDFRFITVSTYASDTTIAQSGTCQVTIQDMGGLAATFTVAGGVFVFGRKDKYPTSALSAIALTFSAGANLRARVTIGGHEPVTESS